MRPVQLDKDICAYIKPKHNLSESMSALSSHWRGGCLIWASFFLVYKYLLNQDLGKAPHYIYQDTKSFNKKLLTVLLLTVALYC